jgi:hypothetical protein
MFEITVTVSRSAGDWRHVLCSLQRKYISGRGTAMGNIQNRTIPVAQLTYAESMFIINLYSIAYLEILQCRLLQHKEAAHAWLEK